MRLAPLASLLLLTALRFLSLCCCTRIDGHLRLGLPLLEARLDWRLCSPQADGETARRRKGGEIRTEMSVEAESSFSSAAQILGHESAGIVTAVGADVKTHQVGDRVALEPGQPCGSCFQCKDGQYNHCADLVFAATPPYDGTLATYYNLHAGFAHKIPAHMTLEEGSLMEPLSVAVQSAVRQGHVQAMSNVVVFGAGPVGLLTAAVCRAMGAKRVCVLVGGKEECKESLGRGVARLSLAAAAAAALSVKIYYRLTRGLCTKQSCGRHY